MTKEQIRKGNAKTNDESGKRGVEKQQCYEQQQTIFIFNQDSFFSQLECLSPQALTSPPSC